MNFFTPWIAFLAFPNTWKHIKYVLGAIEQACFKSWVETMWKRYLCLFGKISGTWKSQSYFEFLGLNDIFVLQTTEFFSIF